MTRDEMLRENPACKHPETCGRILQCAAWLSELQGCRAGQGQNIQAPTLDRFGRVVPQAPTKSAVE